MNDSSGTEPFDVPEAYRRHLNPAFVKLLGVFGYGRVFTGASGCTLEDDQGRTYLDALAAFGSVNIGHNHPRLTARLAAFMGEGHLNLAHTGFSPTVAACAQRLAEVTPDGLEISLFASGGSEAVEAAIKLARAATGRHGVLYCDGGFHGTSLGTLSIMPEARFRAPFEPLLDGCHRIPFGDLEALVAALETHTPAVFVVEPIQAEGGVIIPPAGYLAAAQDACRAAGTVLALDEIQTGLGRTGTLFAFEREGFVPDVLLLAKAMGSGMVPISVALTSAALHQRAYGSMDRFDLHSSTYGGNALGAVAAMETLSIIEDEELVTRSETLGARWLEALREALDGHPLVRDVRGRGLLIGIELGPTGKGLTNRLAPWLVESVSEKVLGQWVVYQLLERGVHCQPASHRWNVIRLEPPLTITGEQAETITGHIVDVLGGYGGVVRLLRDVGKHVGAKAFRDWRQS